MNKMFALAIEEKHKQNMVRLKCLINFTGSPLYEEFWV